MILSALSVGCETENTASRMCGVFASDRGKPASLDQAWQVIRTKAGLGRLRLHDRSRPQAGGDRAGVPSLACPGRGGGGGGEVRPAVSGLPFCTLNRQCREQAGRRESSDAIRIDALRFVIARWGHRYGAATA